MGINEKEATNFSYSYRLEAKDGEHLSIDYLSYM